MRIRLIRNYQIRPTGTVLNNVPVPRAMRMIKNGIAIAVEEPAVVKKPERQKEKSNAGSNP